MRWRRLRCAGCSRSPASNAVTACALIGAIGDISRFPTRAHLVGYLGLDPRVSQSGNEPARHGRISKQGLGQARHMLVEAAWYLARTIGPMRVFHQRIRAGRGANVATVAVARKLAVICGHMLTHEEDYAFARPSLTREKLRRLELLTGAERNRGHLHQSASSARGDKPARQDRAASSCPSAGGHPRSPRRIPPTGGHVQHLILHPYQASIQSKIAVLASRRVGNGRRRSSSFSTVAWEDSQMALS
jgi:hypothetical protein